MPKNINYEPPSPTTIRLLLHNISAGRDCGDMKAPHDIPTRQVLTKYAQIYQSARPSIIALVEVEADTSPTDDRGDGSAKSTLIDDLKNLLGFPYAATHSHAPSKFDPSHTKFEAKSIISRYPILNSKTTPLPNPNLVYWPTPDTVWKSYDINVQTTTIDTPAGPLEVVLFHGTPFHKFGTRLLDPDHPEQFEEYRKQVSAVLRGPESDTHRIIAGDFNNEGLAVEEAFPDLFGDGRFASAVRVKTTMPRFYPDTQFDHVLYTPDTIHVTGSEIIHETPSDHSLIIVDFHLK